MPAGPGQVGACDDGCCCGIPLALQCQRVTGRQQRFGLRIVQRHRARPTGYPIRNHE